MEEIAQFTRSDLQVIDGVLCFNINDDDEKKLKTLNSARIVPVHSELLRLVLERFFEDKEDKERLFSDLSKPNGKRSHNFSKGFIRYLRKCGVTEPGKTFHSFRHTVATIWKRQEVHESIPATLLGHSAEGITYTRYGKGYEIDKLSEVVQLITYPDLDIPSWRPQVEPQKTICQKPGTNLTYELVYVKLATRNNC